MKIQLHDGWTRVRQGADVVYAEKRELVVADAGFDITLPAGMVALEYDAAAGILCYFDEAGNAHPREGAGAEADCDALLAMLPTLQSLKTARETPPPPTPEQIAALQRRQALRAEAAADQFIERLRTATPEEIKTHVQNNVTDLQSARTFIGKLACAVALLIAGS